MPAYRTLAYVHGLRMEDVRVEITPRAFAQHPRSAVCGRELAGGVVSRVTRDPAVVDQVPVIDLQNCHNVRVTEE